MAVNATILFLRAVLITYEIILSNSRMHYYNTYNTVITLDDTIKQLLRHLR